MLTINSVEEFFKNKKVIQMLCQLNGISENKINNLFSNIWQLQIPNPPPPHLSYFLNEIINFTDDFYKSLNERKAKKTKRIKQKEVPEESMGKIFIERKFVDDISLLRNKRIVSLNALRKYFSKYFKHHEFIDIELNYMGDCINVTYFCHNKIEITNSGGHFGIRKTCLLKPTAGLWNDEQ